MNWSFIIINRQLRFYHYVLLFNIFECYRIVVVVFLYVHWNLKLTVLPIFLYRYLATSTQVVLYPLESSRCALERLPACRSHTFVLVFQGSRNANIIHVPIWLKWWPLQARKVLSKVHREHSGKQHNLFPLLLWIYNRSLASLHLLRYIPSLCSHSSDPRLSLTKLLLRSLVLFSHRISLACDGPNLIYSIYS